MDEYLSSMEQLPTQKKKWNVYQFIGIAVLVIGVAITLQASQRSTEQRQFAQTPISYPTPFQTTAPSYYPTPSTNVSTTPRPTIVTNNNPPEKWGTRYARLATTDFSIRVGNQMFYGKEPIQISSDPGLDQQTLEVRWIENNVEMRMFMYFRKKGTNEWELYDLATYNGQQSGNWINYDVTTNPVSSLIGSYNYRYEYRFAAKNGVNAEVYCKDCRIEAFIKPSLTQFSSGYSIEPRLGLGTGQTLELVPFASNYSYAVNAVLYLNNEVVYDRNGVRFEWSSDTPTIVSANENYIAGVSSYIATRGELKPVNFGIATITVAAIRTQDGKVLATASFPAKSGELSNVLNGTPPECSLGVYADSTANVPPNYSLTTPISAVGPTQQIVLATNFFNKTQQQYKKMSYHIALGNFFEFVDSNGSNCSYNAASRTITCNHGLFLKGGATSMAFRVRYTGLKPFPVSLFGTAFASNGDTGSCSTVLNQSQAVLP